MSNLEREAHQPLDDISSSITDAYSFLDDVGRQIGSLRETLVRQVKNLDLSSLRIRVSDFEDDSADSQSSWLTRTCIDTFVIKENKPGRSVPSIYGAFQIGIGPVKKGSEEEFRPHVAVLLAGNAHARDLEQWSCEEFQLDQEFLADSAEWEGEPWISAGENKWTSANGLDLAFVVPLVELANEDDTMEKVVRPMLAALTDILLKSRNL